MAYLNPRIHDMGLASFKAEANRVDLCSQEPATFADVMRYTLGHKAGISVQGPVSVADGRKITVQAFADGVTTGTGDASHWAVVDVANKRLLAAAGMKTVRPVIEGNEFKLDAIQITLRGAENV